MLNHSYLPIAMAHPCFPRTYASPTTARPGADLITEKGQERIDDHIDPDALTWGARSILIEARFVDPIVDGVKADSLAMSRG